MRQTLPQNHTLLYFLVGCTILLLLIFGAYTTMSQKKPAGIFGVSGLVVSVIDHNTLLVRTPLVGSVKFALQPEDSWLWTVRLTNDTAIFYYDGDGADGLPHYTATTSDALIKNQPVRITTTRKLGGQIAQDVKLIVAQSLILFEPATFAHSSATTTHEQKLCFGQHEEFAKNGSGTYTLRTHTEGRFLSMVNFGWCGLPSLEESFAYDTFRVQKLTAGHYKIKITASYGGIHESDEHLRITSSSGDSVFIPDQGGPDRFEYASQEILTVPTQSVDVCTDNGWIEVAGYSNTYPAIGHLDLTKISVLRSGKAKNCSPLSSETTIASPEITKPHASCKNGTIEFPFSETGDKYRIYRCEGIACNPKVPSNFLTIDDASPFTDSFALTHNTIYRYSIRAVKKNSPSPYSDVATVQYACEEENNIKISPCETKTMAGCPSRTTPPVKKTSKQKTTPDTHLDPLRLTVHLQCSQGTLALSWNTLQGTNQYRMYRCEKEDCIPSTEVGRTSTTQFVDYGLTADVREGTHYRYAVRAFNTPTASSTLSAIVETRCLPPPPSSVSLSAHPASVSAGHSTILSYTAKGASRCRLTTDDQILFDRPCVFQDSECNGQIALPITKKTNVLFFCENVAGTVQDQMVVDLVPTL